MMVRSLRFDDELYADLFLAAQKRNVSFNWLVNRLCEEGLERIADELKVTQ